MDKRGIAIILLAYRGAHLHRALSSLRLQKYRDFRVYVCDDASPDNIAGTVSEFEDTLDMIYTRFEENYGIARQSAHLERCLALTRDEPLVCFFSDDNEFSPDALRRIARAARRKEDVSVFHLNTDWIDEASTVTGKGRRYWPKLSPERLFRQIFVSESPAPLSSFFFRREALERAMFQIRDLQRAPLTLVFAAMGNQGRLWTPCHSRLLKRPHSEDYASDPVILLDKALQLQSFFSWSEYFFEGNYPLSPRRRVELFARFAAQMYPARSEEEIREKFLTYRVFEREFGKWKGKRILHRMLTK
ncbi:MAG: glycosyltransferase family 2 protein [Bacteroidales bacterium]|nr:glycosyltransferase family 2 protein [Bacteroidales bacterium]